MFKGKILMLTDSATSATGYGNQADVLLPILVNRGWDVYQIACNSWDLENHAKLENDGFYHYKGIKLIKNDDLGKFDGSIYPSKEFIKTIYDKINPDIVWSLNDFYRVAGLTEINKEFMDKWVHWLPVDNTDNNFNWSSFTSRLNFLVYMSSFGYKEEVGLHDSVKYIDAIYLGVPSNTFFPLGNKNERKMKHGLVSWDNPKSPTPLFVIATVGRHQPRKMINITAEAVGKFMQNHPDTFWICKADPDDVAMADKSIEERDLKGILRKYGVENRVLFEKQLLPPSEMNELYNTSDIFILLSGGEGFGIPCVESMMAGVPCILNDNTTSPELTGYWDFGLSVPIVNKKHFKEYGNCGFDIGNIDIAVERLEFVYNDWKSGGKWLSENGKKAREFHKKWCDVEVVVDKWEEIFYRIMRNNTHVLWHSYFGKGVGFSSVSETIIPVLEDMGYDMYIRDWLSCSSPIIDPYFINLHKKWLANKDKINFDEEPQILCWLMEVFNAISGNYKIGWSLAESTKLRDLYTSQCNKMNYIVTSSQFCKDVQEKAGILSPISIVPPCVSSKQFPYIDRNKYGKRPFTFLHIGVVQERKNSDAVIQGYIDAFPDDGNTRFILKSNDFGELDTWFKPKYGYRKDIEFIYTQVPLKSEELLDLYARADCYVNISHGEGIGMPDIESMSTGLPIIGSNWDTRGVFMDDEVGWMVKISGWGKAYGRTVHEDCGIWADFDQNDYVAKLKYVASHPDEARMKGKVASERIHNDFAPEKAAEALDILLLDIYRKKKSTLEGTTFGEKYYTNIHKYTPDWHEGVAQGIIQMTDGLEGKVLDIGCGRGYLMKHLLQHGKNVEGVELSKWAVEHPMPGCEGKIKEGNAIKMEYPDLYFDWGIGFSLMEHIPEGIVDDVLKEMHRVCKRVLLQIAMPMFPGHDLQIKSEDPTHITVYPVDWWKERFYRNGWEIEKFDGNMTLTLKHMNVKSEPVLATDRILVGIPTKERPDSLRRLFDSLIAQTINNFDVVVVDDSRYAHINEDVGLHQRIEKLAAKGVATLLARGKEMNQAAAHNQIMEHALNNEFYKYKLIFRCDDDITLEPNHLELIFKEFLKDTKCEYAAMGGMIFNPYFDKVPMSQQIMPPDWRNRPEFAGSIDPCVFYAQVLQYPEDVEYRDDIQHLYSTYAYRPELLKSVGGFPAYLSAIAYREETLGLYELHLKGYKMKILTKAWSYHWNERHGGCRSVDERVALELYGQDEGEFRKRLEKLHEKYKK